MNERKTIHEQGAKAVLVSPSLFMLTGSVERLVEVAGDKPLVAISRIEESFRLSRIDDILQLHRRIEAGSQKPFRFIRTEAHGTDGTSGADTRQKHSVFRWILKQG